MLSQYRVNLFASLDIATRLHISGDFLFECGTWENYISLLSQYGVNILLLVNNKWSYFNQLISCLNGIGYEFQWNMTEMLNTW